MIECKYCGKSIPSDAMFCRYCGKSVTDKSSNIENDEKLPPMGPVYASPGRFGERAGCKRSRLFDLLKRRKGR